MPTEPKKRSTQRNGYPNLVAQQEKTADKTPIIIAWITQFGVITVALFTCIASVVGAIVASPYINEHFFRTPTPVATQTFVSGIQVIGTNLLPTEIQSDFQTAASEMIFSESELQTIAATMNTPLVPESEGTLIPPAPDATNSRMFVNLTASLTEGKSPLSVNFNARDSFVQFDDGSTATCGQTGFCTFMWAVYRDQKQIVPPFWGDGTFNYIFSGKGTYSVTVYVCRANACADDGISVTVR